MLASQSETDDDEKVSKKELKRRKRSDSYSRKRSDSYSKAEEKALQLVEDF